MRIFFFAFVFTLILTTLTSCGKSRYYVDYPQEGNPSIQKTLEEKLSGVLEERFRISLQQIEALRLNGKAPSRPPTGAKNAVDDLAIIDNGDGTYTLTWTYKNVGDYNQDGSVNISDIAPLAEEFLKPISPENEWIDGNTDGTIDIGDLSPLAANFFTVVSGYLVEAGETADAEFSEILEVPFSSSIRNGRLSFSVLIEADVSAYNFFRVRPFDAEQLLGEASNVVEKPGIPPPPPPANLPPVAKFSARPTWGVVPFPVLFDASESFDPDGTITLYEWDFQGDGIYDATFQTQTRVNFIYENAGSYQASLRVTDDEGLTSTNHIVIIGVKSVYFSILGRVIQDSGFGLEGVNVSLTPGDISTVTNREGSFTFSGLFSGIYTVELSRADWSITPQVQTVYIYDENVTLEDFSAVWTGTGGRGDWYMFGRDRRHTARSPYVGPSVLIQAFSILDLTTNPVFDNEGTLYAGTSGMFPNDSPTLRGLSAFNSDGSVKWTFGEVEYPKVTPVIDESGRLYFQSEGGPLYCLNPDGTQRWRLDLPKNDKSAPAIADDGTLYVADGDFKIYAIDSKRGQILWEHQFPAPIWSSPAVGDDGTIYIGNTDGSVYALYPTGTVKWRFPTAGQVSSSPAIGDDGTIYIGSEDGNLYALNPDGTLKWKYQTGAAIKFATPSIATDGTIYIGSYDKYLYALNPDGSLRWRYSIDGIGDTVRQATVGADGTLYFSPFWDQILFVPPSHTLVLSPEGALLYDLSSTGSKELDASPIGPDGTLYVLSGRLKVFRRQ